MSDKKPTSPATPAKPKGPQFVPMFLASDLPDDVVQRLCGVLCPPIFATVDMPMFVRAVGASHSLSAVEKWRVFDSLPTLSQFQVDELIKVMQDEALEFGKLVHREWDAISVLTARAWLHFCMVADYLEAGYADEQQERAALAHMLQRKYSSLEHQRWVALAMHERPMARHVFSAFSESKRSRRKQRSPALNAPVSF